MNLEQNKLETIENYYGSIKAYSLFLENLAFNFPNDKINSFLKDKRITLKLTDEAANFIIDHSYNEAYGARPIKRYVTEKLETLIAKKLLSGELKEGTTLEIKVDQNELTI